MFVTLPIRKCVPSLVPLVPYIKTFKYPNTLFIQVFRHLLPISNVSWSSLANEKTFKYVLVLTIKLHSLAQKSKPTTPKKKLTKTPKYLTAKGSSFTRVQLKTVTMEKMGMPKSSCLINSGTEKSQ